MGSMSLGCIRTGKGRRPPPLAPTDDMLAAPFTQSAKPSLRSSTAAVGQSAHPPGIATVNWKLRSISEWLVVYSLHNPIYTNGAGPVQYSSIVEATPTSDQCAHRCGSYYQPPASKQREARHRPGQSQARLLYQYAKASTEHQGSTSPRPRCIKCRASHKGKSLGTGHTCAMGEAAASSAMHKASNEVVVEAMSATPSTNLLQTFGIGGGTSSEREFLRSTFVLATRSHATQGWAPRASAPKIANSLSKGQEQPPFVREPCQANQPP